MVKIGFPIAILAAVSVLSVGSSSAAIGQTAVTQNKKLVAVHPEASPGLRAAAPQVYLLRGLLNVFSLGMDSLASELQSAGISATVANHASWRGLADEIAANYKAGRRGPIVLIGHSLGADAVMLMGERLGQMGIPVALIVPFDGRDTHAATGNVARVLNLYKSPDVKITRGPGFHGVLTNDYIEDSSITHFNIDKSPRLHALVISQIRGLQSTASRPQEHLGDHS